MVKLIRLHQSGFVIVTNSGRFAFDVGSESPSELVERIRPVSAVFASHKHPDHFNKDHIIRLGAPFYAPSDTIREMEGHPVETHAIVAGTPLAVGPLHITAFDCDHGPGLSAPIQNCSLLIEVEGKRIYCVGDMAIPSPHPNLPFDVVLLPVGGSKVFDVSAAIAFVKALAYPGVVIPVHYHGRADRQAGLSFATLAASICKPVVLDVEQELNLSAMGC